MHELKTAIKSKDEPAMRAIRALKAAFQLRKTDGSGKEINQQEEIKIVQKLIKQRKESLDIYETQDREDLAQIERDEIDVLTRYLPDQLSDEELHNMVSQIIENVGASSMKDMGRVMGLATSQLAGKADGKTLATVVKSFLSS